MRPFLLVVILSGACGLGYGGDGGPATGIATGAKAAPAQSAAVVQPPAVKPAPKPPAAKLVNAAPQMKSVSAKTARPGDVISVTGVGLNPHQVDEVYLTDHKFDMKVKLLEQKDQSIKFRVPPFAKPGRMQLLVLTTGDQPKLLEQPFYIVIEQPGAEVKTSEPPKPVVAAPQQQPAPGQVQRAAVQQ